MEILILSMVFAYVVKNGAVDVIHALNGQTSPRRQKARAQFGSGPATRFFSHLWNDSWEDALSRHNQRRSGQQPKVRRPGKPRSAARVFWSGVGQDARRAVRRKWDQGWVSLDEKRRARTTRVPDGTDVVPGEVVPEQPASPAPEPVLPDEPELGTEPLSSTGTADDTSTGTCAKCGGTVLTDGALCSMCTYRLQQERRARDETGTEYRNQEDVIEHEHADQGICPRCGKRALLDPHPGFPPAGVCADCWKKANGYDPSDPGRIHPGDIRTELFGGVRPIRIDFSDMQHPTQEGTPTMSITATAGDLASLNQLIDWCEGSVTAHREQMITIERAMAGMAAGEDTSEANAHLATAMEANATAQSAMESALAALTKEKSIQEQYDANPGAGNREFITGGR